MTLMDKVERNVEASIPFRVGIPFDDIGPSKIVRIYDPELEFHAITVVDNTAIGVAVGGVRMAPDVTEREVYRLARGMTYKNAAAGLKHGGGKSGILVDPTKMTSEYKEEIIRSFARAIRSINKEYIPGPDMGTNETDMAHIYDETGKAVGLPRVLGGIPLDEIGATAYGVYFSAIAAAKFVKRFHPKFEVHGCRIAIEGFGNVGRPAAQFFREHSGVTLVATSDSKGSVISEDGLDIEKLIEIKKNGGSVLDYPGGHIDSKEALLEVDCDILIPSARPDCIHTYNYDKVKAKLIVPGANVPIEQAAEYSLFDKKIIAVPCFIANAGGVICASLEYAGAQEKDVFPTIAAKISSNTIEVFERSFREEKYPRDAAIDIARERVLEAMSYRR